MDWGALYPEASAARTRDQLAQPKTYAPADQGAFSNFGSGVGNYFMRGMAETARNVSMAGAVVPIIADKLIGSDNQGTSLADRYFQTHDEVFQNAVDYWTPKAGTVGKAGEITGQLAAGLVKFIASPALAVADAQLSTSTELTRAGVDTGAALIAGDLAGLSTVAGVAAPFVGRTLAAKMASGVAGNIVPNTLQAAATAGVLTAAGAPEQAKGFDWTDPTARALDVLMGAAFGGAAHYMTKMGERKFTLTDEQKNALLVANQARHLERAADLTATTAESTAHVAAMRQSVDQLLRGEPVNVPERVRLPASESLSTPSTPTPDVMARFSRVESVPVSEIVSTQATRQWDRFNAGDHPPPVVDGYGDKPVAVRMNNGEYLLFDGHHRVERAASDGAKTVDMHVVDANAYDPQNAGRKQTATNHAADAELLASLASELSDPVPPHIKAETAEIQAELVKNAPEQMAPIERPEMADPVRQPETSAGTAPERPPVPDIQVPTGEVAPDGSDVYIPARDLIAKAEAEAEASKTTGVALFKTAAECLLGAL